MKVHVDGQLLDARLRYVNNLGRWALDISGATVTLAWVKQLNMKVEEADVMERVVLSSNGVELPPLTE